MKRFYFLLLILLLSNKLLVGQSKFYLDTLSVYVANSSITSNMTTEMMGQNIESSNNNFSTTTIKFYELKPDKIVFRTTLKQIKGNISNAMQTVTFDTDNKKPNSTERVMQKAINIERIHSINAFGTSLDTILIDNKNTKIENLEKAGISIGNLLIFNKSFFKIPISLNISWNDTIISNDKSKSNEIINYLVKNIELDTVSISFSSNEVYETEIEQMGRPMITKGTKKTAGVYKIDQQSKAIISKIYKTELTSVIEFNAMSIPLNGTINGIITIEKK